MDPEVPATNEEVRRRQSVSDTCRRPISTSVRPAWKNGTSWCFRSSGVEKSGQTKTSVLPVP